MLKLTETRLNIWTKTAGVLAVFVYVCGYLVITIRNANFGFSTGDFVKPRIIAAGATFTFLCVLPSSIAHKTISQESATTPMIGAKKTIGMLVYFFETSTLVFLTGLLVHQQLAPSVKSHLSHRDWLITGGMIAVIGIMSYLRERGVSHIERHPILVILLSVICLSVVIGSQMVKIPDAQPAISVWLVCAGLVGCWLYRRIVKEQLSMGSLAFVSYLFIAGMSYYADFVYPNIYQRWGGGHPVPIEVSLTNKTSNQADPFQKAQLIDQDSAGIYVQYKNPNTAIFIPKESVSKICYLERERPQDIAQMLMPSLFIDNSVPANVADCTP